MALPLTLPRRKKRAPGHSDRTSAKRSVRVRPRPDLLPEVRRLVNSLLFGRRGEKASATREIRSILQGDPTGSDAVERRLVKHQLIGVLLRLVSHRRELCPKLEREFCEFVAENDLPIEFREQVAALGLTGHRRPFQDAALGLLRKRDDGAWNTLYSMLRDKALRVARRLTSGDQQLVDQIAHDASVRFYEHVQRKEEDLEAYVSGFAPLVATITRHLYLDDQEQLRRYRQLPEGEISESALRRRVRQDMDQAEVMVGELGIPELVDMVVCDTPDNQWLEIAHLVARGLNLSKIATALGANRSTIKSKWLRGKQVVLAGINGVRENAK